jgi:nicotinic acid phosphoribosyltransferase
VSWLEPLVLQLHYCIQLATLAKLGQLPNRMTVTCEEQRDIVLSILDSVGAKVQVTIDQEGYYNHVLTRVRELATIVEDPSRIFDVGMRAATCMAQHRIALAACKEAGVTGTSNVELARELELKPVGTMGHEHVQRYGADEPAFRAMRDRHPGPTSFLLDTFSTIHSGLPTAFSLIAEDSTRNDSVRFDSGDKESQFLIACSMARHAGIQPRFILEDGFTADMTRTFETLRVSQHLEPSNVLYGYGGYIVQAPGDTLTRDRVSAVWKITQSGPNPTMKFGDEPGSGKESIPGRPVLHRAYDGSRWFGVVAQEGEELDSVQLYDADPVNHRRLRFAPEEAMEIAKTQGPRPRYSPATKALVETLYAARERHFNPRRQPCLS